MITEPVRVEGGLISGTASTDGKSRVFKGIPFAAPPVGPLRWRPPQPVIPWSGVRAGDRFGPACIQPSLPNDAIMRLLSFADGEPECEQSEDCLYLNVWTPANAADEKLPVIVWIYGGAHRVGAGSHPISGGEGLGRKGAVVVTYNYRLGGLGFLAHPALTAESGASGNYGIMDGIAALQWVKANIAGFGGDPDNVTIFGQSAGAADVNTLMAAPSARGLFHRAIGSAGARLNGGNGGKMQTRAEAEAFGVKLMDELGAKTAEEMRKVPADKMFGPRGIWQIIVDGQVLREAVQSTFAKSQQAKVPLMTGFNAQEASPYPIPEIQTAEAFVAHAQKAYGDQASAFMNMYPARSDDDAKALSYKVARDRHFGWGPWKWSKLHTETSSAPTFMWFFDQQAPMPASLKLREAVPPGGYGSFHGSELWYAFDTQQTKNWAWTDTDRKVADAMSSYLVNFARKGDPNDGTLPRWPRFEPGESRAMIFGAKIGEAPLANRAAMEFFDSQYQKNPSAASH